MTDHTALVHDITTGLQRARTSLADILAADDDIRDVAVLLDRQLALPPLDNDEVDEQDEREQEELEHEREEEDPRDSPSLRGPQTITSTRTACAHTRPTRATSRTTRPWDHLDHVLTRLERAEATLHPWRDQIQVADEALVVLDRTRILLVEHVAQRLAWALMRCTPPVEYEADFFADLQTNLARHASLLQSSSSAPPPAVILTLTPTPSPISSTTVLRPGPGLERARAYADLLRRARGGEAVVLAYGRQQAAATTRQFALLSERGLFCWPEPPAPTSSSMSSSSSSGATYSTEEVQLVLTSIEAGVYLVRRRLALALGGLADLLVGDQHRRRPHHKHQGTCSSSTGSGSGSDVHPAETLLTSMVRIHAVPRVAESVLETPFQVVERLARAVTDHHRGRDRIFDLMRLYQGLTSCIASVDDVYESSHTRLAREIWDSSTPTITSSSSPLPPIPPRLPSVTKWRAPQGILDHLARSIRTSLVQLGALTPPHLLAVKVATPGIHPVVAAVAAHVVRLVATAPGFTPVLGSSSSAAETEKTRSLSFSLSLGEVQARHTIVSAALRLLRTLIEKVDDMVANMSLAARPAFLLTNRAYLLHRLRDGLRGLGEEDEEKEEEEEQQQKVDVRTPDELDEVRPTPTPAPTQLILDQIRHDVAAWESQESRVIVNLCQQYKEAAWGPVVAILDVGASEAWTARGGRDRYLDDHHRSSTQPGHDDDSMSIISATPPGYMLTESARSTIKERFRSFNSLLRAQHEEHGRWDLPIPGLRARLATSVAKDLAAAYEDFLTAHVGLEFSKTPLKYVMYTPRDVSVGLPEDLFRGRAPRHLPRDTPGAHERHAVAKMVGKIKSAATMLRGMGKMGTGRVRFPDLTAAGTITNNNTFPTRSPTPTSTIVQATRPRGPQGCLHSRASSMADDPESGSGRGVGSEDQGPAWRAAMVSRYAPASPRRSPLRAVRGRTPTPTRTQGRTPTPTRTQGRTPTPTRTRIVDEPGPERSESGGSKWLCASTTPRRRLGNAATTEVTEDITERRMVQTPTAGAMTTTRETTVGRSKLATRFNPTPPRRQESRTGWGGERGSRPERRDPLGGPTTPQEGRMPASLVDTGYRDVTRVVRDRTDHIDPSPGLRRPNFFQFHNMPTRHFPTGYTPPAIDSSIRTGYQPHSSVTPTGRAPTKEGGLVQMAPWEQRAGLAQRRSENAEESKLAHDLR